MGTCSSPRTVAQRGSLRRSCPGVLASESALVRAGPMAVDSGLALVRAGPMAVDSGLALVRARPKAVVCLTTAPTSTEITSLASTALGLVSLSAMPGANFEVVVEDLVTSALVDRHASE